MRRTPTITGFVLMGLVALCACKNESPPSAPTSPGADESFVLPGTFAQATTIADLQARFGKSNVKITRVPDGSGGSRSGVTLFPNDSTRRAYVAFHDAKALKDLAGIAVRDAGSRWRGKYGVHIGMSFAELRKRNGKPFFFAGFDEQYRASAHDQWSPSLDDDDNKLGAFDVEEGEHMYFGVDLGLRGKGQDVPAADYPHDEASTSSDDPLYPRLGELVEVTGINATTSLDDEWE